MRGTAAAPGAGDGAEVGGVPGLNVTPPPAPMRSLVAVTPPGAPERTRTCAPPEAASGCATASGWPSTASSAGSSSILSRPPPATPGSRGRCPGSSPSGEASGAAEPKHARRFPDPPRPGPHRPAAPILCPPRCFRRSGPPPRARSRAPDAHSGRWSRPGCGRAASRSSAETPRAPEPWKRTNA